MSGYKLYHPYKAYFKPYYILYINSLTALVIYSHYFSRSDFLFNFDLSMVHIRFCYSNLLFHNSGIAALILCKSYGDSSSEKNPVWLVQAEEIKKR